MTGWFVPGRIEVLGKHTDYGGGRVLVCAVERGVTVHAERIPGPDGRIEATSSEYPGEIRIDAHRESGLPTGHWGRYVQTVADRLTANFGPLPAARIAIQADLPPASGMSSSSAMLTGVAMSLADLGGFPSDARWTAAITDRLSLAGYVASIENGKGFGPLRGRTGVGTSGGSLDHTGMLASQSGQITLAEFDPMRILDRAPLSEQWVFVVAVSGVLAEKTGAAREAYNRGPASLAQTLATWNATTGRDDASVQAAVRSLVGDRAEPIAAGDERLTPLRRVAADGYDARRLDQFLEESTVLVPAAHRALAAGRMQELADIVVRSQALAASHLGNQVPATVELVSLARGLGALAASAFGAGFGGSVWALVPAAEAEGFATAWLQRYRRWLAADGRGVETSPTVLISRPAAPARRLDG